MAFVLPTFPIVCDIYSAGTPPPAGTPRIAGQACQLRAPAANNMVLIASLGTVSSVSLLLPPLTDIRDQFNTPINSADYVEVPAGSGRTYRVIWVDDIAKGFPNEHRYAILQKVLGLPWPTPTP